MDLDELEDSIVGLPLQVRRLEPGRRQARLATFEAGPFTLASLETSFSLTSSGEVDSEHVLLAMPLSPGSGDWNGAPFDPHSAWVYGPGAEHDGVGPHPPVAGAVTFPRAWVESRGAAGCSMTDAVDSWGVIKTPAVGSLARTVSALTSAGDEGVSDRTRSNAAAHLEAVVLEVLAAPLSSTSPAGVVGRQTVAHALDIASSMGPIPSPGEVAVEMGISDRWLRASFKSVFGVSPLTYFRELAMHEAHHDLLAGSPRTTTVTTVALEHGFWHLGRFAAHYRARYGVSPSRTLEASAP